MDHRAITIQPIHGVVRGTMHPTRYGLMIGTIHVPPVQINLQTLIIPVIQHHHPCTQWKVIVRGHVTPDTINRAVHAYCARRDIIVPGITVGMDAPIHTPMHQHHCLQTIILQLWNEPVWLVVLVYHLPVLAMLYSGSQTHVVDFTNIFTIIPVPVDMSQIRHRGGTV